jgi:hypothetical protein
MIGNSNFGCPQIKFCGNTGTSVLYALMLQEQKLVFAMELIWLAESKYELADLFHKKLLCPWLGEAVLASGSLSQELGRSLN